MSRDGFFFDLTNYKERNSVRLPEGEHLVRVTDAELVETKKGDPMVNLFYTVVGGAHDGDPLIDRLVLTDRAAWKVVKVLRALGIKIEKRNMQIPFKQIIGRTLVVTVSDGEPYNGEIRSEVRDYAPGATWKNNVEQAPTARATHDEDIDQLRFDDEDENDDSVRIPQRGEISL